MDSIKSFMIRFRHILAILLYLVYFAGCGEDAKGVLIKSLPPEDPSRIAYDILQKKADKYGCTDFSESRIVYLDNCGGCGAFFAPDTVCIETSERCTNRDVTALTAHELCHKYTGCEMLADMCAEEVRRAL